MNLFRILSALLTGKHDHAHWWRVSHVVRWLVLTRLLRPVPVERAAVLAAVKTKPSAAQVGRS